ncbi:MAG: riboflavin synthase [Desulfobacterales bacterium]|nr:riboflavin synthase [Desulfobacterales bacterium]
MFTGIIEGLGTVVKLRSSGGGKRLAVTTDLELKEMKIGDSIAVNGACLTAVVISANRFEADLSPETLSRTTLNKVKTGDRVNLERALRISDRLDGHLVSGHIDGIGTLSGREGDDNAVTITIAVPEALSRYLIPKGSVAVDGISLTVNHCSHDRFSVSIIPYTSKLTTLGFKKKGDVVNIETDMIGKYVERFVQLPGAGRQKKPAEKSVVDMELLLKSGFL